MRSIRVVTLLLLFAFVCALPAVGKPADLWINSPGQRWDDFTHATDEVVIVLEGEMEFEVESEGHHP